MSELDRTRVEAEQTKVVADATSDPVSAETDRSPAPRGSEPKLDASLDEPANVHQNTWQATISPTQSQFDQAGDRVGDAPVEPDGGFGAGVTPESLVDQLDDITLPTEDLVGDEIVFAQEELVGNEIALVEDGLGGDQLIPFDEEPTFEESSALSEAENISTFSRVEAVIDGY